MDRVVQNNTEDIFTGCQKAETSDFASENFGAYRSHFKCGNFDCFCYVVGPKSNDNIPLLVMLAPTHVNRKAKSSDEMVRSFWPGTFEAAARKACSGDLKAFLFAVADETGNLCIGGVSFQTQFQLGAFLPQVDPSKKDQCIKFTSPPVWKTFGPYSLKEFVGLFVCTFGIVDSTFMSVEGSVCDFVKNHKSAESTGKNVIQIFNALHQDKGLQSACFVPFDEELIKRSLRNKEKSREQANEQQVQTPTAVQPTQPVQPVQPLAAFGNNVIFPVTTTVTSAAVKAGAAVGKARATVEGFLGSIFKNPSQLDADSDDLPNSPPQKAPERAMSTIVKPQEQPKEPKAVKKAHECPVCFLGMREEDYVILLGEDQPCGQMLCSGCAQGILGSPKKECPFCRKPATGVVKLILPRSDDE